MPSRQTGLIYFDSGTDMATVSWSSAYVLIVQVSRDLADEESGVRRLHLDWLRFVLFQIR